VLSFSKFWRHGIKKAFRKSWKKYGHALIAFGLLYTVGAICLSKYANAKVWGVDVSLWLRLIIPGVPFISFVGYHLLRAPYEIYRELYKKMDDEIAATYAVNKILADKIQRIKDSKPPSDLLPSRSGGCGLDLNVRPRS
jgi:D-alanyl-lipoteichoic acid acyltransferase DltB (MBOAT superfamily)